MPYKVMKKGSKAKPWCTMEKKNGKWKVKKCYKRKSSAVDYKNALYANVQDA